MPEYYYYNTLDNKISTTNLINMCQTIGPITLCRAASIEDQNGCKHREDASYAKHCMHWRENLDGACDSVWAQRRIDNPHKEKNDVKEEKS